MPGGLGLPLRPGTGRAGETGLVCFLQPMPFPRARVFPWPWLKQLNGCSMSLSFPNTALLPQDMLQVSAFLWSGR